MDRFLRVGTTSFGAPNKIEFPNFRIGAGVLALRILPNSQRAQRLDVMAHTRLEFDIRSVLRITNSSTE